MDWRIEKFEPQSAVAWDSIATASPQATFLHTRRFLSYHGDRFSDNSLIIRSDRGDLVALLPAALDPDDPTKVISHPGATFGGLVVAEKIGPRHLLEALEEVGNHYKELGCHSISYKPVPLIYQRRPRSDDIFALHRLGARRTRCDLSATIDLHDRAAVRRRRKRDVRSRAPAIRIASGTDYLTELWPVVVENRRDRHGVAPTHTVDEIVGLAARFPEVIECSVAFVDDEIVAGCVIFRSPRVDHLQYMANSERGRETHALDVLLETLITNARKRQARFFDFGISTEGPESILNEGLHTYKASFGAGSTLYERYELRL